MRSFLRLAAPLLLSAVSTALPAAEPVPKIGPQPSWVTPPELPALQRDKADGPLQFLISSSQERITAAGVENYVEYAAIPLNAAGLQALGNVTVPWNTRADLTLHKVVIRREGKEVSVLKTADIMVLRRENNLEKAMLDGVRTVVIPAKGLEVGDTLNVAFSLNVKTSPIMRRPEEIQSLTAPFPIRQIERRFLVADEVKLSWKVAPVIPQPIVSKSAGATEYRFLASDVKPSEPPKNAPARFTQPGIQLSAYSSWGEVADQLAPAFAEARHLDDGAALMVEANKIAAASQDPGYRLLKALQLAQEKVRYVALLLGDGAYVPVSAAETWERKYGDCKGKTVVLLALLDRLGVDAEPMLVSNQFDDRLGEQLPSLLVFDHVIVRARIGSATYFLDPTDYGQRTLAELTIPGFSHGLPLRPATALTSLPHGSLDKPLKEISVTWDARNEADGEFPYEAMLILRGAAAAEMRAKLAAATDAAKLEEQLENLVPMIENDDLEIVEKDPESADGSFVVRFKGTAEMDWSPFEGKREQRFAFSNSTISWNADFNRTDGQGKDWPVFIGARPYWERLTESVLLPASGKGYSLEGEQLERSVAGSLVSRKVEFTGNRATMTSDFRHLKREISADEARSAVPILEQISDDYTYVVGPPKRKQAKKS